MKRWNRMKKYCNMMFHLKIFRMTSQRMKLNGSKLWLNTFLPGRHVLKETTNRFLTMIFAQFAMLMLNQLLLSLVTIVLAGYIFRISFPTWIETELEDIIICFLRRSCIIHHIMNRGECFFCKGVIEKVIDDDGVVLHDVNAPSQDSDSEVMVGPSDQ